MGQSRYGILKSVGHMVALVSLQEPRTPGDDDAREPPSGASASPRARDGSREGRAFPRSQGLCALHSLIRYAEPEKLRKGIVASLALFRRHLESERRFVGLERLQEGALQHDAAALLALVGLSFLQPHDVILPAASRAEQDVLVLHAENIGHRLLVDEYIVHEQYAQPGDRRHAFLRHLDLDLEALVDLEHGRQVVLHQELSEEV